MEEKDLPDPEKVVKQIEMLEALAERRGKHYVELLTVLSGLALVQKHVGGHFDRAHLVHAGAYCLAAYHMIHRAKIGKSQIDFSVEVFADLDMLVGAGK